MITRQRNGEGVGIQMRAGSNYSAFLSIKADVLAKEKKEVRTWKPTQLKWMQPVRVLSLLRSEK